MGGGGGEGSTADTSRKRPERPWTAARRGWGRLLHCAIAVSAAVLGSPTFAAQLHLPAHDLFWANLRVQLHLPPLHLAVLGSPSLITLTASAELK